MIDLEAEFGHIDIYLFDQILRGRIGSRDRVVDAGCGFGRNLIFLMRQGIDVYGLDPDADAIAEVRALAATLAPQGQADRFRAESLQHSSFPDHFATAVISSAVLHFARDSAEFAAMLAGTWRLLAPGGVMFCRLASRIGFEHRVRAIGAEPAPGEGGRHHLPDGTDRYLVDETLLINLTASLGGALLDPLKTTIVQDQRAMTTWVIRRSNAD